MLGKAELNLLCDVSEDRTGNQRVEIAKADVIVLDVQQ